MGYQEDYYKQNREKLLTRRRLRYETDPEYRERAKKRSRVRNAMLTLARISKLAKVTHAGGEEKGILTSELPKHIRRTVQTVRVWKRRGIIPKAVYRHGKRDLYAMSQVLYMVRLFSLIDSGSICLSYPDVGKVLRVVWPLSYDEKSLNAAIAAVIRREHDSQGERREEKERIKKAVREGFTPKGRVL